MKSKLTIFTRGSNNYKLPNIAMAKLKINKTYVYYIFFPIFLCCTLYFAYHLGYQNAKLDIAHRDDLENKVVKKVYKEPQQLSFFNELKKNDLSVSDKSKKLLKPFKSKASKKSKALEQLEKNKTPNPSQSNLKSNQENVVLNRSNNNSIEKSLVIQLSAFKDLNRANILLDKLAKKNFMAFVLSKAGKDKSIVWHRVFVGPYISNILALKDIQKLDQLGFGKGYVVKNPKNIL